MVTEPLSEIPLSAEVLSRTPPEAIDLIVLLLRQVAALQAQVEALQARIAALEAQLNKNSANSNKPPSSDSQYFADLTNNVGDDEASKALLSADPSLLHSKGAMYCSKKQFRDAYLAFAEALFAQRNPGRIYGHLFRMACCMTLNNNFAAAYPLFRFSLENLRNNFLFMEFFSYASKYLSTEIITCVSPLFIVSDDIYKYSEWLERNPFLMSCLIDINTDKRMDRKFVELLNIKVIDKKSTRTIICFTSRNDKINELYFQLMYILTEYECNLIFVRDVQDAWYLKGLKYVTRGVADTVEYLKNRIVSLLPPPPRAPEFFAR
jgi:tetratricopeptide (TPR) repeat protein